jgi:hypothetical protein|tara:strand:+ start:479 stop:922 length:444 start_codon:yes stop_codon:yes gene_type:complete
MATVEELKRLKKRKKAEVKAKSKSMSKSGETGGSGQDYVTSGKGDLNRKDYIEIREYKPTSSGKTDGKKGGGVPIYGGGKPVSIKNYKTPEAWAEKLYADNPIDPVTKKTLSDVNHLMWTDNKVYKTSPKVDSKLNSKPTQADKLKV